MRKEIVKLRCIIYVMFLFFISTLISCFIQPRVFCAERETADRIQGFAVWNENAVEKTGTKNVELMGAFATSDAPSSQPILLSFEFVTFQTLYMGVVIINSDDKDRDVEVVFDISGPVNIREKKEITVPANTTYYAYIEDIFSRPGFYTFKGSIRGGGSSKIRILLTEE